MNKKRLGVKSLCSIGWVLFGVQASAQDVSLALKLRGVFDSKATLLAVAGNGIKEVTAVSSIRGGTSTVLRIPKDMLPGEFVLRMDFKEKPSGISYPSEKRLIVNAENIELVVNPKFMNNPDSTYYLKGGEEDALLSRFSRENAKKKDQLNLLHNFLIGYEEIQTEVYRAAILEFEKKRTAYNSWLRGWASENKSHFVSRTFQLERVSKTDWTGSESDRVKSMLENYFDGIDFSDPQILKTRDLSNWMDVYVNIYGTMVRSERERDSLFTLAGRRAIEKSRDGHPLVYGWMVDYFYKGYESFNIKTGIEMLNTFLSDPRCITSRRMEIEKRLKGIDSIVPGRLAPDFYAVGTSNKKTLFSNYKTDLPFKLVLFWSADCHHCKELVKELYPWYKSVGRKTMEVFALSMDFTELEVLRWETAKLALPGWVHSRPQGGVNSHEAQAYYILSTPVMVLVDSKTNTIVALPANIKQLKSAVETGLAQIAGI
jgi:hypothetical protein